ncbi:MAG: hypothetical protein WDM87_05445 [Terracidiphilus sp.]
MPTVMLAPASLNLIGLPNASSTLTVSTTAASSAKIVDPPDRGFAGLLLPRRCWLASSSGLCPCDVAYGET